MSKNLVFILAIGTVVLATPFVSIPNAWKNPFYIIFGVIIAYISYRERHGKRKTTSIGGKKMKKVVGGVTHVETPGEGVTEPLVTQKGEL